MLKLIEKPTSPRRLSASQKVSRKYRKDHQRRLRKAEYKKLKAIVPSISRKEKVEKITVIEEAIKYIDELHLALLKRLQMVPQGAGQSLLTQIPPEQIVRQITSLSHLPPLTKPRAPHTRAIHFRS